MFKTVKSCRIDFVFMDESVPVFVGFFESIPEWGIIYHWHHRPFKCVFMEMNDFNNHLKLL